MQGSRDRDGRAVPCRLAQPGSHSGCLSGSYQQERPCLSGKRAPWAQCASGSCVERLASDRHGGIICNAPRLSCALSQRPVPDLRKSCKVGAGVAVPVERDLEFPAQSRQCSASALKRSPEYLEMQDRYQDSLSFSFFFLLLCVFGDLGSIRRMQVGYFTWGHHCSELSAQGEGK